MGIMPFFARASRTEWCLRRKASMANNARCHARICHSGCQKQYVTTRTQKVRRSPTHRYGLTLAPPCYVRTVCPTTQDDWSFTDVHSTKTTATDPRDSVSAPVLALRKPHSLSGASAGHFVLVTARTRWGEIRRKQCQHYRRRLATTRRGDTVSRSLVRTRNTVARNAPRK